MNYLFKKVTDINQILKGKRYMITNKESIQDPAFKDVVFSKLKKADYSQIKDCIKLEGINDNSNFYIYLNNNSDLKYYDLYEIINIENNNPNYIDKLANQENIKEIIKLKRELRKKDKKIKVLKRAIKDKNKQKGKEDKWTLYRTQNEAIVFNYRANVYYYNKDLSIKVVISSEDVGVTVEGISRCHPEDVFDIHTGRILALERARIKFIETILNKERE